MSERQVIFSDSKSSVLLRQKEYMNGCPFNASPYIGCFGGCRYCYTQASPVRFHIIPGAVQVKTRFPEKFNSHLENYSTLPQHLKRIQINESCEYYLPEVLEKMEQELHRDIMVETLGVLKRHWDNGNRWMLHIVTKSPLILKHLSLLSAIREMIQVEMTLICLDETRRRSVESNPFTVNDRLEAIRKLSRNGIFVRIMSMPFFGSKEEAMALKEKAFEYGAQAFKHKGLNYFEWDRLVRDDRSRTGNREDSIYTDLLVKSGEPFIREGRQPTIRLLMPNSRWKKSYVGNLEERDVSMINFGYSGLNDIDWGYIN